MIPYYAKNEGETIHGEYGADKLIGGDGDDVIHAGGGNDVIIGGKGNDKLYGEDGSDIISGGEGDDEIYGGRGSDIITGGEGDDVLAGGENDDTYIWAMGEGTDIIVDTNNDYNTIIITRGVEFDYEFLNTMIDNKWKLCILAKSSDDKLIIENQNSIKEVFFENTLSSVIVENNNYKWIGTTENDLLTLVDSKQPTNYVYGWNGDDTIEGSRGDDHIEGGKGIDNLYGGEGIDTYYWEPGDGSDFIHEVGSGNILKIFNSSPADYEYFFKDESTRGGDVERFIMVKNVATEEVIRVSTKNSISDIEMILFANNDTSINLLFDIPERLTSSNDIVNTKD